jgi:hypothetical protein
MIKNEAMENRLTGAYNDDDMRVLSKMLDIGGIAPVRNLVVGECMMDVWTGRCPSVFVMTDQWGCCRICREMCKGHLINMLPGSNLSGTGAYYMDMHVDCFGRMDKIRVVLDRGARWRLARWALMLPLPTDVRGCIAAVAHSVVRGYVWTRQ